MQNILIPKILHIRELKLPLYRQRRVLFTRGCPLPWLLISIERLSMRGEGKFLIFCCVMKQIRISTLTVKSAKIRKISIIGRPGLERSLQKRTKNRVQMISEKSKILSFNSENFFRSYFSAAPPRNKSGIRADEFLRGSGNLEAINPEVMRNNMEKETRTF